VNFARPDSSVTRLADKDVKIVPLVATRPTTAAWRALIVPWEPTRTACVSPHVSRVASERNRPPRGRLAVSIAPPEPSRAAWAKLLAARVTPERTRTPRHCLNVCSALRVITRRRTPWATDKLRAKNAQSASSPPLPGSPPVLHAPSASIRTSRALRAANVARLERPRAAPGPSNASRAWQDPTLRPVAPTLARPVISARPTRSPRRLRALNVRLDSLRRLNPHRVALRVLPARSPATWERAPAPTVSSEATCRLSTPPCAPAVRQDPSPPQ
jgi:hypothetical protein